MNRALTITKAKQNVAAPLWMEQVPGDAMEPTLRSRYDHVLLTPVKGYVGEGIYAISREFGWDLYRAAPMASGKLRLYRDNKHYGEQTVDRDWFAANVIGVVVADIKVRDESFFRQRAAAA